MKISLLFQLTPITFFNPSYGPACAFSSLTAFYSLIQIPDGVAPFSAKSFLPLSVRYIHHGTDKYGCIRIAVD